MRHGLRDTGHMHGTALRQTQSEEQKAAATQLKDKAACWTDDLYHRYQ